MVRVVEVCLGMQRDFRSVWKKRRIPLRSDRVSTLEQFPESLLGMTDRRSGSLTDKSVYVDGKEGIARDAVVLTEVEE